MRYIKPFDTLRAFAVLLVIASHWVPVRAIREGPWGPVGVTLFFVLSGFLITSILFHQRNTPALSTARLMKNFYVRRTLRIFPIYYLTIILLFLLQRYTHTQIGSSFAYHFFYLSNVYFFKTGAWDGLLSPFWSLAVEEQFYLIWPPLVLLTPRQYIRHLIALFIAIGVASQYYFRDHSFARILTFACFDAFGIGALLAWFTVYKKESLRRFYAWSKPLAAVALLLFAVQLYRQEGFVLLRTTISLISVWAITAILIHEKNLRFGAILNNNLLIYLGKISYGLYLYHLVAHQLITINLLDKYLNPYLPESITRYRKLFLLAEDTVVLLVVASLSYYFIEKPFLSLKRHFEHPASAPANPEGKEKTVRPAVITNQSVGL